VTEIVQRVLFPLRLARTRITARPAATASVAAGVAVAVAALCSSFGGSLLVEDLNLERHLDAIPPNEQTVQVLHLGVLGGDTSLAQVDEAARATIAALTADEPAAAVEFRALHFGARRVVLTALDDLEPALTLERGRWPRRCSAARCEVVVARGASTFLRLNEPFVVVGRARVRSRVPVGRLFEDAAPSGETLGAEPPAALVVASGARELAALPALASIYRTYSWVGRLRENDVRPWQVRAFARSVAREGSSLRLVSGGFDIVAPVAELLEAAELGRAAGRHLQLLGGESAALVFAFALFVASAMRRQERAASDRLRWVGARQWQIVLTTGAHATATICAGAVAGIVAGTGVIAVVARRAQLPWVDVVAHGLGRAATAVGLSVLFGIVAFCVVVLVDSVSVGGRRISPLDVAALAALAGIGLVVRGGSARGEDDSTLVLLPGLVLLVVAVATIRALLPILRLAQPLLRRGAPKLRLSALSLARSEAAATAAVAFLVVSVAVAVFAVGYRQTLLEASTAQGLYAVPSDFVIREHLGPGGLQPVLDAAPIERYRALGTALPVLRQQGSIGQIVGTERFTILGLPARRLSGLGGWQNDFAAQPLAELARTLDTGLPEGLLGVSVPAGAATLALPVRVVGDDVSLSVVLVDAGGRPHRVALGRSRGVRQILLEAELPGAPEPFRAIGFELDRVAAVEAHAQGNPPILRGLLRLGALRTRGADGSLSILVDSYASWVGVGGAQPAAPFGPNAVDFLVGGAAKSFFRAEQPSDTTPVPAAVSRSLAGLADARGHLSVRVPAGVLDLDVVATLERFPTIEGSAIVADRAALSAALDTLRVGSGRPNEVWLDARRDDEVAAMRAALGQPPFERLSVDAQKQRLERLRGDPLARGTTVMLAAAGVLALLLALLAVAVLALSDRRDRREELLDLELEGMTPRELRAHLRLRIALVAVPGLVLGTAAGILLAQTVVDFVRLSRLYAPAVPPIVLRPGWLLILPVLGSFLLAAGAVAFALTGVAFRGRDAEGDRA